ncbi:MAG: helix-turn-helix domain-containing protein [Armatimonadota bacterium]|nr:helix-turn-helix domain-containing protein [Armatimonadota bacterium]
MPHLTTDAREALTGARRRQILEAATRVFADKGYAAATVRDIARAARIAEGTIYNYFKSKEDLLIHIPGQIAGPAFERLALDLAEARTPQDAERHLMALGQDIVQRISANVRFVKVFLSALPHLSPRARREYLRLLPLAASTALEAHLRQGMAVGIYREDLDPSVVARTLPGMLLMFVVIQEIILGERAPSAGYEAVVRENVRVFLDGIRVHGAPYPER